MVKEHKLNKVDIFATGKDPINKTGEFFASTTDSWFPLWTYVTIICEDLLSDEESNLGFFPKELKTTIEQDHAIQMARIIHQEIENGNAQEFAIKTFPEANDFLFSVEELGTFASFCGLSGGFNLS
jgi:hypothetical protein